MGFLDSVRDLLGEELTYSSSGSLWNTPATVGAVCVCVAEIRMLPGGMPVFFSASAFAASISSLGIMQLSTTTIASFVLPSSRTRQRAWSGSLAACRLAVGEPAVHRDRKLLGRDILCIGAGPEGVLLREDGACDSQHCNEDDKCSGQWSAWVESPCRVEDTRIAGSEVAKKDARNRSLSPTNDGGSPRRASR